MCLIVSMLLMFFAPLIWFYPPPYGPHGALDCEKSAQDKSSRTGGAVLVFGEYTWGNTWSGLLFLVGRVISADRWLKSSCGMGFRWRRSPVQVRRRRFRLGAV